MRKAITKTLVNPADSAAVTAVINKYLVNEDAVFCTLLDVEDKIIAGTRVYKISDTPFDLTENEIDYLTGGIPDETWSDDLVKCFLDKHRIEYTDETTDFLSLISEDISTSYVPGTAPTLEQKQFALNQEKKSRLNAGFDLDDVHYDYDINARIAYRELADELREDPSYITPWKASEGIWVTMDATLYSQVKQAGKAHIASVFAWLQTELDKLS